SGITKAIDCPNCYKKLDSVVEGRKTKMQKYILNGSL
ncbi:hypothetical protein O439_02708, partial [Staphylococcus aureus M0310]